MTKQLWYGTHDTRGDAERHRIVAIDYYDGWPCSVITEEHWDHSRKPWFVLGRDRPSGTVAEHWDFSYSRIEETLYFHNSGGGGQPEFHIARFVHWKRTPGRLWIAPGVPILKYRQRSSRGDHWRHHYDRLTSDFDLYKMGYKRLREPLMLSDGFNRSRNPFEVGQESETVYCDECRDDRSDTGEAPCEHMHWCDECSAWIYTTSRRWVECESSTCDCPPEEDD